MFLGLQKKIRGFFQSSDFIYLEKPIFFDPDDDKSFCSA